MTKVTESSFLPVDHALLEIFEHSLDKFEEIEAPYDGCELTLSDPQFLA
jgi:hypothetical protein